MRAPGNSRTPLARRLHAGGIIRVNDARGTRARVRVLLPVDEPLKQRVTAAHLMAAKNESTAAAQIAALLGVERMPATLAAKTIREIAVFLSEGDATTAAQLIHASIVRRRRRTVKSPGSV
jgi:hypothetical protein